MSIKPVTYQGLKNFKANLYALEIKSRFIDQSAADGYYKGYGDELNAIVSSNIITIGSGALLVQGRLNEIETGGESVEVTIQNGLVGYVVARIETYHPDDYNNCVLLAKTGTSLESITLAQEDTYQRSSDGQNKIYELPLYSFSMENGAITNLTKLISPVEENTRTRDIANQALAKINEVINLVNSLLDQSYAATAGHATTADSAGHATTADSADHATTADNITPYQYRQYSDSDSSFTLPLFETGKIYVISVKDINDSEFETMVIYPGEYGNQSTYSTKSRNGYSCRYDWNSKNLWVYNPNGTAYKPAVFFWRAF